MLSCVIDAKENRYVKVSDIPGAFLLTDMEENVHLILEGTVAEMIIKLDPTIYQNTCGTKTWENDAIFTAQKCLIQDTISSATDLETIVRDTAGMGLYTDPI